MTTMPAAEVSRFCWMDLAASDAPAASAFYTALLGWRAGVHTANGGQLIRFSADGRPVASLYQLSRRHLGDGVPSHWTPYVAVADVAQSASRAEALGARVIVAAFELPGIARISLLQDPVGAVIGLWQRVE